MEIFGGFMVMISILAFFLAVVWLIMPFVVLAIKGKQDKTLELLEAVDRRLGQLEAKIERLAECRRQQTAAAPTAGTAEETAVEDLLP